MSEQEASHAQCDSASEPCCPFCGRDPYHYVDIGVGNEAVAVTCCEPGIALFDTRGETPETVTLGWDDFRSIADRLGKARRDYDHGYGVGYEDGVKEASLDSRSPAEGGSEDIVAKLRAGFFMREEAADEIERLRAELSAYAGQNTNLRNDLVLMGIARDHALAQVEDAHRLLREARRFIEADPTALPRYPLLNQIRAALTSAALKTEEPK